MSVVSTGTYKLVPTSILSQTGWKSTGDLVPPGSYDPARDVDVLRVIQPREFYPGLAENAAVISSQVAGATSTILANSDTLVPAIKLNSAPWSTFADLPAGFTPTSATVTGGIDSSGDHTAAAFIAFGFGPEGPAGSLDYYVPYPSPEFPNAAALFLEGVKLRATSTATSVALIGDGTGGALYISGSYAIVWFWWKKPAKDACGNTQTPALTFVPSDVDPPEGFERYDPDDDDAHPTPTIVALEANHGPTLGGNAVTIRGDGFGEDATVTFGGVDATSVVVVDQHTITCVAPPHVVGQATVVVTNADGTTS